jgi:nicotinic acid mononucleotide adenylyltransferase
MNKHGLLIGRDKYEELREWKKLVGTQPNSAIVCHTNRRLVK